MVPMIENELCKRSRDRVKFSRRVPDPEHNRNQKPQNCNVCHQILQQRGKNLEMNSKITMGLLYTHKYCSQGVETSRTDDNLMHTPGGKKLVPQVRNVIGLASATSQPRNQRSNRQNWFQTKIASHTKACWEIVDRLKNGLALSDPQYLVKRDAQSSEGVVKTVRTSLRRNKELRQWETFLPACFCMGRCLCLEPIFPVATRC